MAALTTNNDSFINWRSFLHFSVNKPGYYPIRWRITFSFLKAISNKHIRSPFLSVSNDRTIFFRIRFVLLHKINSVSLLRTYNFVRANMKLLATMLYTYTNISNVYCLLRFPTGVNTEARQPKRHFMHFQWLISISW